MSSTCSMSSHPPIRTQRTSGMAATASCVTYIGTNRGKLCSGQRSNSSRMTIPGSLGAYSSSQGYSISVGNRAEEKRLLIHALKLWRERGDSDYWVARTLQRLAEANRLLGLHEEGIQQAKEALGVFERLGDTAEQAGCLARLAHLFWRQAARRSGRSHIRSINLLGKGQELNSANLTGFLGYISFQRGEREGHSPLQHSPWNRGHIQLARSTVLDPRLPGNTVSR
jgi:hypothetical protein